MAYDGIDGQLRDGERPIKTVGRARYQTPVQRTDSVTNQARLLWGVLLVYAKQQQSPAEGGYYFDARVQEIAREVYTGVRWSDPKHVSNFLRPILGYLMSSGNARIISKSDGSRNPYHYKMWIRDEWSTKRGTYVGVDRESTRNIVCPCKKAFLTNAAFSQHKRGCPAYAADQVRLAEIEAYIEAEEREHPVEEFVPIEGTQGMDRTDYLSAGKNRTSDVQRTADRYEALLRSLSRDWKRRTPESLGNLFATLDGLDL